MDLKAIGEEIAKIGLPLLGAVLPIPGGAAIGAALASAIGSPSSAPADILAKLTQDADALQKARQFELTHQETMLKLTLDAQANERATAVQLAQTDAADRDSARRRQTAVRDLTPAGLAWLLVSASMALAVVLIMGWAPTARDAETAQLVGVVLGYVFSESKQAIAYFLGGSSGETQSKQVIANIAQGPQS
jgi:hypothetical protein